ncbi:uncharacterized protein LOC143845284 [Paroedura picta]|uniref:uncharacterized protein LOC143845284 n=1 Tax=Paroedura picta TaxID=143630 RepID=UPI0040576249
MGCTVEDAPAKACDFVMARCKPGACSASPLTCAWPLCFYLLATHADARGSGRSIKARTESWRAHCTWNHSSCFRREIGEQNNNNRKVEKCSGISLACRKSQVLAEFKHAKGAKDLCRKRRQRLGIWLITFFRCRRLQNTLRSLVRSPRPVSELSLNDKDCEASHSRAKVIMDRMASAAFVNNCNHP